MNKSALASLNIAISQTKTSELVTQISTALMAAGIPYQVEKITLRPIDKVPCKCLEYGVIGTDTTCTPQPEGGEICVEKPIYGCMYWDCTK